MQWNLGPACSSRLEITGDSKLVVNWINGTWRCRFNVYGRRLRKLHGSLEDMSKNLGLRPRQDSADWSRHAHRELNSEADSLATRHAYSYTEFLQDRNFRHFRIFFDGSCAASGSGGGWILYGSAGIENDALLEWTKISSLSFSLEKGATVTAAELEAALWSVAYFHAWLRGPAAATANAQKWKVLDTRRFKVLDLAGLIDGM